MFDSKLGILVNDIHSNLNETPVQAVLQPTTNEEVCEIVKKARKKGQKIAVSGYRHSMGGQQFLKNEILLDMRKMCKLLKIDNETRIATFQSGANWIEVQEQLSEHFSNDGLGFTFRQKQTGADRLSLGGSIAVNAHGRGLNLQAMIADVESIKFVNANGDLQKASRTENQEQFSAIVGGYGLFGVVTEIDLRLVPREKQERIVEIVSAPNLMENFEKRIAEGFTFGDFQFSIDSESENFLQKGVFSCYRPVSSDTPMNDSKKELVDDDWFKLLWLAHFNKSKAYEKYTQFYLSTNRQIYWSDTQQGGVYLDGYHSRLDNISKSPTKGTELITELYVERQNITLFLESAAALLKKLNANVVYGTVRLIQKDDESMLTWARKDWACTVMNLHVDHTPEGMKAAKTSFLALIDLALEFQGSYFLTYHNWASKEQIEKAHPNMQNFLNLKKKYDPQEIFSSNFYEDLKAKFKSAQNKLLKAV